MKTVRLIFICSLLSFPLYGYTQSENNDSIAIVLLKNEMENYIFKTKEHFNSFESDHGNFIIFVLNMKQSLDSIEFSMSYIMNSRDYKLLHPKGFVMLGKEYILLKFDNKVNKDLIQKLGFIMPNRNTEVKIVQKLFPSDLGGINYNPSAIIGSWNGEKFYTKYFVFANEVPFGKSIWE